MGQRRCRARDKMKNKGYSGKPVTVSVVIITYNQQHCVGRAIAGVMHQRGNFRIELIVANDASTDKTLAVVKRWQELYPSSIRVIDHKNNIGFRANYLSAFREATGDYVCVCDADDYWTSDRKLRRQVEYMEAHRECAVTFHRVLNVYHPSGVKTLSNGSQAVDTTIEHLSRSNYITNLSVMYRRCVVEGGYPDWLAEVSLPDYAYHILHSLHGTIHYFRQPMGVYTQSSEGAWSLSGERRRLEMALDGREKLIEHLGEDSAAAAGLMAASTDILVALAELEDSVEIRERIRRYSPQLTDDDIDKRIAARREIMRRAKRLTIKGVLKKAYRAMSRLRRVPRPC